MGQDDSVVSGVFQLRSHSSKVWEGHTVFPSLEPQTGAG